MENFCDDLMIEIFSHMSFVERIHLQSVCRRWMFLLRHTCAPRRLRIEHTPYPREPRRVVCECREHAFENAVTLRPQDERRLKELSSVLEHQGAQLISLCLQLTYFNHLSWLLQHREWLHALCRRCPRLEHLQLHAYGLALTPSLIIHLQPLISRLTHLAIDYKEEDISKQREQPWIEPLLQASNCMNMLFIKFKRIAIRFPVHCPLPYTLRALLLPSCSMNANQLLQLIEQGGDRLEQLSLHSITSDCLYLFVDKMPNLRRLSIGIRVDTNGMRSDPAVRQFQHLRGLEQLCLHRVHLMDEPFTMLNGDSRDPTGQLAGIAANNNGLNPKNNTDYTVCEVLTNCPPVETLKIKHLPLLRRRNGNLETHFIRRPSVQAMQMDSPPGSPPNEMIHPNPIHPPRRDNIFGQLMDQYLEQRLVMDAFGSNQMSGMQGNADEQRSISAQLRQLLQPQPTDNLFFSANLGQNQSSNHLNCTGPPVRNLHIRLDEPLLDCHYRQALDALLRALCSFRRLRSLQIVNVLDGFVSAQTVRKLVISCAQLQKLEIGTGKCISAEVLQLFVERALLCPKRRFELKMRYEEPLLVGIEKAKLPSNLIIY